MGKNSNALKSNILEHLKWEGKDYKRFDTGGLYLHVKKNGCYWRMKYTFNKKEKLLSFGSLKKVSLSDARNLRNKAKDLLSQGVDPSIQKQIAKKASIEAYNNTFELIAREWWETVHVKKVVPDHAEKNIRRLEQNIFPFIGNLPITEVSSMNILECLRRIEARGHNETARRVKGICSKVFRFAISTGRTQFDMTSPLTDLLEPVKVKNHSAITDPVEFSKLLKLIDGYSGSPITRAALLLSPLVFVRPVELRKAKWEQINFETNTWEFIPSKIRNRNNSSDINLIHIVPLANQAITILKDLYPLTRKSIYVFPSFRSPGKPMSNNTVRGALRNLGMTNDEMTGHGFRASARTMLEEVLDYDSKFIEKQLAHVVKDPNGTAYNRTKFIKERTTMMQHWADYLDTLRTK